MQTRIVIFAFIIAIVLPVLLYNWGITESSEARYAEISREMYQGGDYVNPKLLGINHYHKPPAAYYITALGYFIFGVNEAGVRFFPAIALLFQLLLVFKITNLLFNDRKIAFTAVLIYFSYPIVHAATRNLTTDCFLTTFIFASIYFYLKHRKAGTGYGFIYLFYIFCGLSFLTKGPVGILPSCLFAMLYNWLSGTKKKMTFHHFTAFFLFILICFSWFLFLLLDNPLLFDYFVKYQLVDRVASNSFGRTEPFWYYLAFLPLAGLPVILIAIDYVVQHVSKLRLLKPVHLITALTFFICFIVFSASASKLILYVVPLYLFIALLSAWHLSVMSERKQSLYLNIFFYYVLFLLTTVIAAGAIIKDLVIPWLPVITGSVSGMVLIIWFRNKKGIPVPVTAALLPALGMAILSFIVPPVLASNELKINSAKPIARFINQQKNGSASIVVYDQFLPSLEFYTGKKLATIHHVNSKSKRETQFEKPGSDGKKRYFEVSSDMGTAAFQQLAEMNDLCIVAKLNAPLPDSLRFLARHLHHESVIGKWIIYY
jgi:4-amino-4-deoxy-L-arabinose transferase-like glycosyltransferase